MVKNFEVGKKYRRISRDIPSLVGVPVESLRIKE